MAFKKIVLAIVMLIAVTANFKTVEAAESTPYIYYGTIDSFIEKINYILDRNAGGEFSSYKLSNPKYQDMQLFGGGLVGEITMSTHDFSAIGMGHLPTSTIKFHSTLKDSAIYQIEIQDTSSDQKIHDKTMAIFGATILATDVPRDEYQRFYESFYKWILNEKYLPAKKTFKLWHPQMGRYIVVKIEISGNGVCDIKINGKFS